MNLQNQSIDIFLKKKKYQNYKYLDPVQKMIYLDLILLFFEHSREPNHPITLTKHVDMLKTTLVQLFLCMDQCHIS